MKVAVLCIVLALFLIGTQAGVPHQIQTGSGIYAYWVFTSNVIERYYGSYVFATKPVVEPFITNSFTPATTYWTTLPAEWKTSITESGTSITSGASSMVIPGLILYSVLSMLFL